MAERARRREHPIARQGTDATGVVREPPVPVGPAHQVPDLLDALATATPVGVWRAHGGDEAELYAVQIRVAQGRPLTFLIRVDHARSGTVRAAAMLRMDAPGAVEVASVFDGSARGLIWRAVDPAQARASLEFALAVPRRPIGIDACHPSQLVRPLLSRMLQCLPAPDPGAVDDRTELAKEPRYRRPRHDACEALHLRTSCGMRSRRFGAALLAELVALVGGSDVLATLDTEALPDEAFDRTGVAADVGERAEQVLELCDRACDQHFCVEVRTASRRLLHHVATHNPKALRGNGSAHTAAAAIVWTVASRNHLLGTPGLTVKQLLQSFAVSGSVASRAAGLLRPAGLPPDARAPRFSSRFLTADRRAALISLRDGLARMRVVRLRILLEGTSPPIERVVDVEQDQDLEHLHDLVQTLYGWHGTRPAEFRIGQLLARIEAIQPDRRPWDMSAAGLGEVDLDEVIAATDLQRGARRLVRGDQPAPVAMAEVGLGAVSVGDRFTYRYGSRWVHTLTVESVTPLLEHHEPLPRLVSASRAAPPESVDGSAGYQRVLDLMGTSREHELAERLHGCPPALPGCFDPWRPDPDVVDLDRMAQLLSGLFS